METSHAVVTAQQILFIAGVILAGGSVIGFVAQKFRIPDIVLFLLIGIVLGPQVTHLIAVDAGTALNQLILIFGASYILFDGGASLRLAVLKDVWISLLLLTTVGVLISALLVAPLAELVLGIPFLAALLLGSTIAPTDPATLIPVFKQVRIRPRVAQTVITESALNDATGSIIAVTILAILVNADHVSVGRAFVHLGEQAAVGIFTGLALGYLAVFAIAHERFSFLRDYMPVVSLMVVIGAYLAAKNLDASGFMAAFIAGVVVGNKELFGFQMAPHEQESLEDYITTTSLIARMFIFVLLGSQVDFNLLKEYWIGAVIVVLFLILIARPITVFLCAAPDRRANWGMDELLFMSWVRETGVIPSALAGLLVGLKVPHAHVIASVVFVAVLLTILMQAPTTRWWGLKLGLEEG